MKPRSGSMIPGAKLLPLFVYSMDSYNRIISELPVSQGLLEFDRTSKTIESATKNLSSDQAAIDVRLMLQRKYFVREDPFHLRELIKKALELELLTAKESRQFLEKLQKVNNAPLEILTSTGEKISGQFKNAEDVITAFFSMPTTTKQCA